jgi:uncharacterized membrane protein YvbJ
MKYCPKCSAKQEDWVLVCDCGHDFEKTTGAKESPQNDCKNTLKGKYQALWTISYYFKLLAWINLGGATINQVKCTVSKFRLKLTAKF